MAEAIVPHIPVRTCSGVLLVVGLLEGIRASLYHSAPVGLWEVDKFLVEPDRCEGVADVVVEVRRERFDRLRMGEGGEEGVA